ncbi:MAG: hypothetical protein SWK76_16990 [Actinomycetota bacterium]|nr:hypothetical protein [Actinomycetota bacterium]
MSKKKLKVYVEGDAKSAEKALDDLGEKSSTLGDKLGKAVKIGAAVGAAALTAFGFAIRNTLEDLQRIERLGAQTDAAITSTGGAANVSRQEIESLADELEKLSSVEAESIQQGQNMLLTFTNIKNGVGEANDIFNQATETALDMSVALGQDMQQTAIQVGKALNDPIQGVTALRRVGVQLSEQQQQQVADFMAVNDIASAQKVILGELETQFGGSAEALGKTLSGQIEIMKHHLGDFMEVGIAPMMPAIGEVVSSLTEMFKSLDPSILANAFDSIGDILMGLTPMLGEGLSLLFEIMAEVGPIITEALASVFEAVMPLIQELGPPIAQITSVLAQLFSEVLSGLTPVIQALAPIIATIVEHVAAFLEKAAPILGEIAAKLGEILSRILKKMEPYLDRILDAVFGIIEALLPILPTILDLIEPLLDVLLELIPPLATIVEWGAKIAEMIAGALGKAFEWIAGVVSGFGDVWSNVWNGVKSVFEGVWNGIVWFKDTVIMPVVEVLKNVWNGLQSVWSSVWNTLKGIVKGAALGILYVLRPIAYALDCMAFWSGEATLEGPILRAIEAVRAWHSGGPILEGLIPGNGEVMIPMGLFKGGEWILNERATAMLGREALGAMNKGIMPAVAGGSGGPEIHIHFEGNVISDDRSWEEMARKIRFVYGPRIARSLGVSA